MGQNWLVSPGSPPPVTKTFIVYLIQVSAAFGHAHFVLPFSGTFIGLAMGQVHLQNDYMPQTIVYYVAAPLNLVRTPQLSMSTQQLWTHAFCSLCRLCPHVVFHMYM